MAVPSSGNPITMRGIFSEKNENDYGAQNIDGENSISLRGLSSNSHSDTASGGNINLATDSAAGAPNQTAPFAMSEFFDYDHDATSVQNFAWSSNSTTAPSAYFVLTSSDINSNDSCHGGCRIDFTWNSTNLGITFEEYTVGNNNASNVTSQSSTTNINFSGSTSTISSIQARWRLVDASYFIGEGSGGTTNTIQALYKTNGHDVTTSNDTTTQTIASGSQNVINQDFTGSFVTITPSAYNGTVQQSYALNCFSDGGDDDARLKLTASGDSFNLDVKVNLTDGSSTTHTITKPYVSSSNPDMLATTFSVGGFSCLLPTMNVLEETKGMIPVSAVAVGDKLLTIADLNNTSGSDTYTPVTKNDIHNRSGYWNVESGLKITNDHPVWLSDESSSAWVKVEDMRPAINRTYHAGAVDTHYIETDAGHFYTFHEDVSKETPGYKWIVSGNYSPETD